MLTANHNIRNFPANSLIPYQGNARTHSDKQIQQIANSIKAFGFLNPILIDENNMVIAGHGRLQAAVKLGIKEVPTLLINHLSPEQKRAYILADNRIAEKAGWDKDILAIELQALLDFDCDFDISLTGFEMAEVDILLGDTPEQTSANEFIVPPAQKSITQAGDIWLLGAHKIICGDSLKADTYQELLGEELAHTIFTDPPYNVPINGHVCGNGKTKHREFAMASGEMSQDEFLRFLGDSLKLSTTHSTEGSIHFVCMDWRHMWELLSVGRDIYTELKNICVWNKSNGGMGSLYRSKHEMVAVFKKGTSPHTNNIELGQHGRYRTNVWDYPSANALNGKKQKDLDFHPTVKPIALVSDALQDCSKRNDIVLDPFGGSGTTLLAAERTGRRARLIEIDPSYVDVTIRRWQQMTGKEAIRQHDGKAFNAMTAMEGEGHE